jgi:hypothetical protein
LIYFSEPRVEVPDFRWAELSAGVWEHPALGVWAAAPVEGRAVRPGWPPNLFRAIRFAGQAHIRRAVEPVTRAHPHCLRPQDRLPACLVLPAPTPSRRSQRRLHCGTSIFAPAPKKIGLTLADAIRCRVIRAIDPPGTHHYTRALEPVAQVVEHLTFNQVVLGSSPSGLTIQNQGLSSN